MATVKRTATNRSTGKKTTTYKELTPVTKKQFVSTGAYSKKSTPRSTTTAYKQAQKEKFALKNSRKR